VEASRQPHKRPREVSSEVETICAEGNEGATRAKKARVPPNNDGLTSNCFKFALVNGSLVTARQTNRRKKPNQEQQQGSTQQEQRNHLIETQQQEEQQKQKESQEKEWREQQEQREQRVQQQQRRVQEWQKEVEEEARLQPADFCLVR